MSLSRYLHKRMVDLLNDRRIVVWYDAEGDFAGFVEGFKAPNCEVFSTTNSVLRARRRADEIYRHMNESEKAAESSRCILIYVPAGRGTNEEEKMLDPFEGYAVAGAAFGDTEDQQLESLARQAMPEKSDEVTRLFKEGKPNLSLLDALEKSQRWPLLDGVFHTETPADVIALALCDFAKAKTVDDTPGCIDELLRLFETSVGFKPTSSSKKWKSLRPKAMEYVLFSEFVLDLPGGTPDALNAVPRAEEAARSTVYAACDRMRSDTDLRDTYIESAHKIEADLRLPEVMPVDFDPGERDTFPFEERRLLGFAVEAAVAGDMDRCGKLIKGRERSVWRREPQRSPAWTALERGTALLTRLSDMDKGAAAKKSPEALLKVYTEAGWCDIDRCQRLFETALTACADEDALTTLVDRCRRAYRDAALALQKTFLEAVQSGGWPPDGLARQTRIFDDYVAPALDQREKTALFLVDSLRFEMGCDLGEALGDEGEVEVDYAAGVLPTVTTCGMAALLPGADGMLRLVKHQDDLVPAIGTRIVKTSQDRMKLLAEIYGDRFFETTLDDLLASAKKVLARAKDADLFVVRTQDPDAIAENLGPWRARRYLSDVIGDIASAARAVASSGFSRVVITSDHGHVMLPEVPPGDVVESPPGGWLENKRRCRLGSGLSGGAGTINMKAGHVGIQGDVEEICLPLGFRVFSAGEGYFHGGLSLQEAVVPVVVLRAAKGAAVAGGKPDIEIRYRSDRFTSRVIGLNLHLQGDIFGTPAAVRIEAFDGSGAKAIQVGEAADCEARDEKTRVVTLAANKETPVPVLLDPDFEGLEVEVRVSDPETRVVWAKKKLRNAMLD